MASTHLASGLVWLVNLSYLTASYATRLHTENALGIFRLNKPDNKRTGTMCFVPVPLLSRPFSPSTSQTNPSTPQTKQTGQHKDWDEKHTSSPSPLVVALVQSKYTQCIFSMKQYQLAPFYVFLSYKAFFVCVCVCVFCFFIWSRVADLRSCCEHCS